MMFIQRIGKLATRRPGKAGMVRGILSGIIQKIEWIDVPLLAAGWIGSAQHSNLLAKMECGHETATSHLLLGSSAV